METGEGFLEVIPGRPEGGQATARSQGVSSGKEDIGGELVAWELGRNVTGGHKLGWALQRLVISRDPNRIWASTPPPTKRFRNARNKGFSS